METRYDIYENDTALKTVIERILPSFPKSIPKIALINIMYTSMEIGKTHYPGIKYAISLRTKERDPSRILFYGFENPASLRKKTMSSILESSAVTYIQLPCKTKDISKSVQKLAKILKVTNRLDPETKQTEALSKLNTLIHELQNALNTVDIVKRLKRAESKDSLQTIWRKTSDYLLSSTDLIHKNRVYFQEIKEYLKEILKAKQIVEIENELVDLAQEYNALLSILRRANLPEKEALLSKAEMISISLYRIIKILKKDEEG